MLAEFLPQLPLLLAAGALAGFISGLLGIGGGIVTTPLLYYVFGLTGVDPAIQMHLALGSSLAVIVPTIMSSVRAHHKRGAVIMDVLKFWAPFLLLGAGAGSAAAAYLSSDMLVMVFAGLALVMGGRMLLPTTERQAERTMPGGVKGAGAPMLVGFLASLMGIGGATFSVPYLRYFGTPMHQAVGTAAACGLIVSSMAVAGFIIAGWSSTGAKPPFTIGFVSLPAVAIIAPLSVLAAPYGARLAHAVSQRTLSVIFGLFLLLVSARLWWSIL